MTEPISKQAHLERIDWQGSFPFLRLFRALGMAVEPQKLMVALVMVLVIYLGGRLMDAIWGRQVYRDEFRSFIAQPTMERFESWRSLQTTPTKGVFETVLSEKIGALQRMVGAAMDLDLGLNELIEPRTHRPTSVIGALREMTISLPNWLWQTHPWFLAIYGLVGLAIWGLLGGAMARLAALEATRQLRAPASEAVLFAWSRWGWFFSAPLIPLLVVGVGSLLLALGGLVFFNVPGLDIVGALLFGLMLVGGAVVAAGLIVLVAGVHLFTPAIAVEGADAFVAVSQTFNYLLARPWRWAFYSLVSLVYGAICYIVVGVILLMALNLTHTLVGWWVVAEARPGLTRFDAMLEVPRVGEFSYAIQWQSLGWTGKVAASLIAVWTYSFLGLLLAFAISFYVCVQTQIYLLLRQSVDGTPMHEVFEEPAPKEAPAAAGGSEAIEPPIAPSGQQG